MAGLDAGDHVDEASATVQRRGYVEGDSAVRREVRVGAPGFRGVRGGQADAEGPGGVGAREEPSRRGGEDRGIGPHGHDVEAVGALLSSSHHRSEV